MSALMQWPKSLPLDRTGNWTKEWVLWLQSHSVPGGIPISVSDGGTGLTTTPSNGQLLIGNAGAYSIAPLTAGSGIGVTGGPGSITVANTGVTSNIAGTGIGVSGATGAVTISNTGVTSITGTANQVIASGSTGGVTLSTPQSIGTGSAVTFGSITLGSGTALSTYVESSFTGTLTGCTTSPTGTISYIKIGKQVTIDVPTGFTGTSNAIGKTITGAPAAIFPTATKYFVVAISDNGGGTVFALGQIDSSGVITLFTTPAGGPWTAAGTATINRFCFTYTLL